MSVISVNGRTVLKSNMTNLGHEIFTQININGHISSVFVYHVIITNSGTNMKFFLR